MINDRSYITTDSTDNKRKIRKYFELCANKFNNK